MSALAIEPPCASGLRVFGAGVENVLIAAAVVVSLGLVASASLGGAALQVGIRAAFVSVIAGGLVYALLGSTASPAASPSSATTVIYAGLVAVVGHDPGVDLATVHGMLSLVAVLATAVIAMGLLQCAFGLSGLGRLARYVPQPVLAGFMNGVALVILVGQVRPLLGLPRSADLTDRATLLASEPAALLIGLTAAASIWLLASRAQAPFWRRLPAPLVGLLAGVALQQALSHLLPSVGFGRMVGELPQGWVVPDALRPLADDATRALWQRHAGAVLSTALVLALIGSLESLLAALAIDQVSARPHDSRRELLALGAANIGSGLCGGLPLSLSRARANGLIGAHAVGRVAPVVAALAFAALYAAGGPLLARVPSAVLAGVMLPVAFALSDRWTHQLLRQWRDGERSSELRWSLAVIAAVCVVTFAWGFLAGVAAGVLLSMLVFVASVHRSLLRDRYRGDDRPSRRIYRPEQERLLQTLRARIVVLELEGALFFGSGARLGAECDALPADCRCLVLDLRRVSTIDESGAMLLEQLSRRLPRRGITLLLAGVAADNRHGRRLRTFGCFRAEPRADWWPDTDRALEAAERQLLAEAGVDEPESTVAVADSALLRGLAPSQRTAVLEVLAVRRLGAGERLFDEGEPGDALYVLSEGSISIVASHAGHGQRLVSFSSGMMFGETAMLDGGGRSASAVADAAAVVHGLSKTTFEALSHADPALGQRLALNIAVHLSERLRGASMAWRASAG